MKTKRMRITIFVLALLIVAELIVFLKANSEWQVKNISHEVLKKYAEQMIAKCKDAPFKPKCYDEEIPKLMDKISMEQAFQVTKIVQDFDTSYAYCHVLGHELSAREVKKDPSKWKDVLTRCPSGQCSNGCLHGGLQEKFRAESLTDSQIKEYLKDFMVLCEPRDTWNPTGLEQGSCYHAMGHLMMYVTNADIPKALSLCGKVALKDKTDWRQVCYDGVFMQMFQPLEPEDFALVKGKQPTKDTVDKFCASYSNTEKASCHSESWPLFSDEITKPQGLEKFCNKAETNYRQRCFNALFYIITSQLNLDSKRVIDFCKEINLERRGLCFANAASRMIEVDYRNIEKAVELCNTANNLNVGDECYDELVTYSTFNFHSGSKESMKVCNSLPEKWKTQCIGKQNSSRN